MQMRLLRDVQYQHATRLSKHINAITVPALPYMEVDDAAEQLQR